MNEGALKQLALQTLYGDRIGPRGSCFRTNDAGIELAECGVDALPVIENVIETVVRPTLDDSTADDVGDFIGLNYLIGAYLVIGVRTNEQRVFDFIRAQPTSIQVEAINCSSTFFFKTADGYNFGVSPNERLLNFLNDAAQSPDKQIADLASDVRQELTESLAAQ